MTLIDKVAALFRANPDRWVDGHALARVGGYAAWRSRVSDLRRAPFFMTIINRQRRVATSDGATFVISEYMHVVASESAAMGFHDISAVDATSTTTS